jgi:Arylsulfotransferase (ASST)
MLGYGFLCLLAGMAVVAFKMFPYGFVRDAWLGAQAALYFVEPEDRTGWRRSHEAGVHRYDPARAHDGVTLYTSSHAQKAFLIDMQGKVLHEWYLPRNAASNASSEGSDPAEDIKFYWADVELYSNGDLLVIYHAADQTPYGYGLAKIDKDSKLIWADLTHAHHDVSIGEDGLIYTLTQRIRQDPVPALPALTSPMLEDFVLVLSPSGERLKEISIYETLAKSRFGSVLDDFRPGSKGDHFHANDVDPVGSETAAALPFAREGQVLVSLRNLSALALIDLDSEEVVWLSQGSWRRQHDPDFMDGGRLLLFDNVGDLGADGHSRVLEFDPVTQEITWQHKTRDGEILFSPWGANQQYLPNGNVLITETVRGRLIEVTRDGDIVWEYFNGARDERPEYAAVILNAKRLMPKNLHFAFNS